METSDVVIILIPCILIGIGYILGSVAIAAAGLLIMVIGFVVFGAFVK